MGVNYQIRSESGKVLVAHHNNFKTYLLTQETGDLICSGRETGDIEVVQHEIPQFNATPGNPSHRVRPPHLRQVIRPPDRYTSFSPSQTTVIVEIVCSCLFSGRELKKGEVMLRYPSPFLVN